METYEELREKNLGGGFPILETGVASDYINAWMGLGFIKSGTVPIETESCWRKIVYYEDYLREKNYPYIERRIAESDRRRIIALNMLADSFNFIREQLKEYKNVQAAVAFFDIASILIRGY